MNRSKKETRFLSILCAAGILLSGCSQVDIAKDKMTSLIKGDREASAFPMRAQLTIPVTRGKIGTAVTFVGNVEYSQSSELKWQTPGVIKSVNVKVGDHVKKGDILAELETDSLNSNVLAAEKTKNDYAEKLDDVRNSETDKMNSYLILSEKEKALTDAKLAQEALYFPRSTKMDKDKAWDEYALANLNFNYAKQDYDAIISMNMAWDYETHPMQIIKGRGRPQIINGDYLQSGRQRKLNEYQSAYDTLVTAYENYVWVTGEPSDVDYSVAEGKVALAQKEYDEALKEYRTYQNGPREKDIMSASVNYTNATNTYNKRYIIADFDGEITEVSAVEGYYITKGTSAIRMDDKSKMFVPFEISEMDIKNIHIGDPVTITFDAAPGKIYDGTVYTIAEATESSDNRTTFSASALIDQPDNSLFSGMTGEVSVTIREKENVLLVPNTALTYQNNSTYVTLPGEKGNQLVEVKIGDVTSLVSEIVSGNIKEGDQVIVDTISTEAAAVLGVDPEEIERSFEYLEPGEPPSDPSSFPPEEPDAGKEIPEKAPQTDPSSGPSADKKENEKPMDPEENKPAFEKPASGKPPSDPSSFPPAKPDAEKEFPEKAPQRDPSSGPSAETEGNEKPMDIKPIETDGSSEITINAERK